MQHECILEPHIDRPSMSLTDSALSRPERGEPLPGGTDSHHGIYPQRRGPMKAIVAAAAKLLTAISFIIRDKVDYHDPGASHFDELDRTRPTRRRVRQLEALGYSVELKSAA